MDKAKYRIIEEYMLSCMANCDIAHDSQHIYRVLYNGLEISMGYEVDEEVLIAACLLHDIGRNIQLNEFGKDHAVEGAGLAYKYLISIGWCEEKASHVKECIATHAYREENPPASIEAKIVFDSDKLDVTGAVGIVRYIAHSAIVSQPLYSVCSNGQVLPGNDNEEPSFFKAYNDDLMKTKDRLYTEKAKEIAEGRKQACVDIYNSLYGEVGKVNRDGLSNLNLVLKG